MYQRQVGTDVGTLPMSLNLVMLLLFLPEEASFSILDMRLTAVRLIFLLLAPLVLLRLLHKLTNGDYCFVWSDLFVTLAAFWMIIGPSNIVGLSDALKHGGPIALEFFVGYMSTRVLLREHGHGIYFAESFTRITAAVALLGLLDPLTHHFFIRGLAAKLTGYGKGAWFYEGLTRNGIVRATATLEHPIAFGLVSTIGLLLSAYIPTRARKFSIPACSIGVIISITSVAWGGMMLGFMLVGYNRLLQGVKYRWSGLISMALFSIFVIYISVANPLGFIFRHLIFDPDSGYFREYTWDVAGAALAHSPWFGLGFTLPDFYDIPYTVDSVWLESALTFGVPGSLFIALSIIGATSLPTSGPGVRLTKRESRLGRILGIITFLLVFWGFTVHYWGTDWIVIALLAGLRAHLGELGRILKRPPKTVDRAYPLVKNQEYAYDWEHRSG